MKKVTSFNGCANPKISRIYSYFDGNIRISIRYLFPKGIGKVDVYHGEKQ